MFGISSLSTLALATLTIASPVLVDRRSFEVKNGVNYTVFEHRATDSKLSFVTNSGVCETTPGINQYSGYFSVGTNMVNNSLLRDILSYSGWHVLRVCGFGSSKPAATLLPRPSPYGSMGVLVVAAWLASSRRMAHAPSTTHLDLLQC